MMILRNVSVAIGCVALLGAGYWHGVQGGRFGTNELLLNAAQRVHQVPMQIDDWVGTERESDPVSFKMAGADAYWTRVYHHPRLRTPILVILMCGRSGKMSVHTPEVCYAGAGYEMVNHPTLFAMKSEIGEENFGRFLSARFGKSRGLDQRLVWAWATSGEWQAPDSPRLAFAGQPFLYKLYISQEIGPGPQDPDPLQEFMREFLPELKQTLLPMQK